MSLASSLRVLPFAGPPGPVISSPPERVQDLRYHMLLKPVGAVCNLDCTYCFYLHKQDLLHQPRMPHMSEGVLEQHTRQYLESQPTGEVVFSWQGGEPTLAGLDFFRRAVELQGKYRRAGQRVLNDLQTNGTLLDDQWAAFLKQHGFLVGLSCDGPRDLHDRYRVNKGGEPTFNKVMATARLLGKYGVPFNALCVINRENAKRPLDVYRFLTREFGTKRVQFIPCVEPRTFDKHAPRPDGPTVGSPEARPGNPNSIVTDWSVDPEDWGSFLCRVWDDWFRRDVGKVLVNLFETAIQQSMGQPAQVCTQAEFCGKALMLEHDGDVFSCDHFAYPEYRLGNISQVHEADLVVGNQQVGFGMAKRDSLPQYCRTCEHLALCWGECPRNRFVSTPDGQPGLNYLCQGFKRFYSHIRADVQSIIHRSSGN